MVRVTPFLPLISSASLFLAPAATATPAAVADIRRESYAAVLLPAQLSPVAVAAVSGYRMRRQLLTCEQTYGADWIQCGDAESTYCFNPREGQTCCAQDAGYCDAGTWCAPVPGFCCLDGEDVATCAVEAGFELPTTAASSLPSVTSSSTATTTRSSSTTVISSTTTSTTLLSTSTSSNSSSSAATASTTSFTSAGGLTWTSAYPATITGFGNGSTSTNSTSSATPSSTYVQISVAQKEQWTLVWMTVAIGVVGVFMATC
ncbi:hypothetical protein GE09DRAFT_448498 [Coniochaeta sp. 2T2.1]|nr:hypothetical protein GE09DRAFT_448498 [Coniochaeta sp. 2T2.1]